MVHLSAERQLEIEARTRALRYQVFAQRKSIWPDRIPRGLEVADPAIVAQVLGIKFEYHEEIRYNIGQAAESEIAGLLDRRKGRILVARKFGPEVARFTAAHEIGHWDLHDSMLQHRDLPIEGLERSAPDLLEREADYFAACLLMPRKYVADQFRKRFLSDGQFVFDDNSAYYLRPNDVRALLYPPEHSLLRETVLASAQSFGVGRYFDSLAKEFKVSIKTMAIRIRELRLVRT